MNQDETKARLSAYLDGALGDEERAAMEKSMATDDALRAELEALKGIDAPLKALPEPEAPAGYFDSFRSRLDARIDAEAPPAASKTPAPVVAPSSGPGMFAAAAAAQTPVPVEKGKDKAGGEESGLKDLRQLAERAATRTSTDDLPSISALSALTGRPSVTGMRVRVPRDDGSETGPPPWLWWTLSGLGLATVVVVVMAVKIINKEPERPLVVAVNQPAPAAAPVGLTAPAAAPAMPEAVPLATAAPAPEPVAVEAEPRALPQEPAPPVASPAADPVPAAAAVKADEKADSRRVAAVPKKASAGGSAKAASKSEESPAPEASAPPPAEKPAAPAGKTGDLDSLLDGAIIRGGPKIEPDTTPAAAEKPAKGKVAAKEAASMPAEEAPPAVKEVGEEDLKKVLDGLSPRMRACFKKFQISGSADVTVVVAPSGKMQSSALKGDFLETPTGDCVMGVLKSASFPSFKGGALTINHSYPLR